jgi:GTP cyclohydrolase I
MKLEKLLTEQLDEMGDQHQPGSKETPLRPDAFKMSNTEKVLLIEEKIQEVLHVLGMDLTDDSLKALQEGWPKCLSTKFLAVCIPTTSPSLPPSKTNTSTEKCWSKKTSPSTPLANTICFPLLEKPM